MISKQKVNFAINFSKKKRCAAKETETGEKRHGGVLFVENTGKFYQKRRQERTENIAREEARKAMHKKWERLVNAEKIGMTKEEFETYTWQELEQWEFDPSVLSLEQLEWYENRDWEEPGRAVLENGTPDYVPASVLANNPFENKAILEKAEVTKKPRECRNYDLLNQNHGIGTKKTKKQRNRSLKFLVHGRYS